VARISIKNTSSISDFSGAMTDISFLLIIFFIISAVFITDQGIFLKLPDPDAPPRTLSREEVVSILITEPGVYTLDGATTSAMDLRSMLEGKVGLFDEPIVVLTVASEINYQEVLSVLEEARYAGYSGFSIQTDLEMPLGLEIGPE
jgi:biopolymer transport protein ExbD